MADGSCDARLFNIVILGVSFMLIFTAFQTCSMVEKSVLDSARNETNGTYTGDGYTSLSIIYAVFAVANWGAPSVVSVCGPKISMIIGGVTYLLFIASFLYPMTWALYVGSVLVGIGAAVIWTAQGNFLTINSDSETVARNSGIFWALLQCSLLFGNLYVYFDFKGDITIPKKARFNLFAVLTGTCLVGILSLFILRKRRAEDSNDLINLNSSGSDHGQQSNGALDALKRSFNLMRTKEMILLSICFAYTGLELTFFSGVYGASIGNTLHFGQEAKGLIGISGIFIGVGEIVGGGTFGLFGNRTNKYGRDPIVLFGWFIHLAAFYVIFINLPDQSPIHNTSDKTYIESNKYVAIACSFMLGLGDSSFNTQIYSLLGFMFPEDSAPAFALYKCVQSVAAAVAFAYSTAIMMQWQLLILVVMATLGAYCFFLVEWAVYKVADEGYGKI